MTTVLLIIHLLVTLALIGVVLIQRSEGGGLGIGTSQGMGGFMSGRGTANLLTRTTAILGAIFFGLSLALALLNRGTVGVGRSLLDNPPPVSAPAAGPALSGAPTGADPSPSTPGAGAATPGAGAASPGAGAESQPSPAAPAAPKPPAVPTN
jgi:preprotein translocase subunit SecG